MLVGGFLGKDTMENEKIGEMMMFGSMVSFCNCETCKLFLTGEDGTMPTKLGRIVEGENDSMDATESMIDTMDA